MIGRKESRQTKAWNQIDCQSKEENEGIKIFVSIISWRCNIETSCPSLRPNSNVKCLVVLFKFAAILGVYCLSRWGRLLLAGQPTLRLLMLWMAVREEQGAGSEKFGGHGIVVGSWTRGRCHSIVFLCSGEPGWKGTANRWLWEDSYSYQRVPTSECDVPR